MTLPLVQKPRHGDEIAEKSGDSLIASFQLQNYHDELEEKINEIIDAFKSGNGTPEGNVVGKISDTYRRLDGGALTSFYVKESGTGNTGWVAK